jgi:hypothetical protein
MRGWIQGCCSICTYLRAGLLRQLFYAYQGRWEKLEKKSKSLNPTSVETYLVKSWCALKRELWRIKGRINKLWNWLFGFALLIGNACYWIWTFFLPEENMK